MSFAYDLRKEEDVKEYLHNIGIEYRFGCYSEKKPEVCHLLGMYLDVIQKNREQAKKVYKVNCDTYKWSFSCYKYAYLQDQEKKPEFVDEIIDYYSRGCANGLTKSCYLTGVKYGAKSEKIESTEDKQTGFKKALEYMNMACDQGLGQACFNLSSIYFNGIPDINMHKDLRKVFEYTSKACEYKHVNACSNLSLMYLKGEGIEKNVELGKKYQQRAKELWEELNSEGIKFEEGLS